jgi:hypothetical protein
MQRRTGPEATGDGEMWLPVVDSSRRFQMAFSRPDKIPLPLERRNPNPMGTARAISRAHGYDGSVS